MKSTKTKKSIPVATVVPNPRDTKTIEIIAEIRLTFSSCAQAPADPASVALYNKMQDEKKNERYKLLGELFALYTDSPSSLQTLKDTLNNSFTAPTDQSVIKNQIACLLFETNYLQKCIYNQNYEEFKSLLELSNKQSLELIIHALPINKGEFHYNFNLLSWTVVNGTPNMTRHLIKKKYQVNSLMKPVSITSAAGTKLITITNPLAILLYYHKDVLVTTGEDSYKIADKDEMTILESVNTLFEDTSVNHKKLGHWLTEIDPVTSRYFNSPLLEAIHRDFDKVAAFLIHQGADLEATTQYKAVRQNPIDGGIKTTTLRAIDYIVHTNRLGLLQCVTKPKLRELTQKKWKGQTILQRSIDSDGLPCMKYLIRERLFHDVNVQNEVKETALMMAAFHGDVWLTNRLLKQGADPNKINNVGNTALHFATRQGHLSVVASLLEAGSSVNLGNKFGYTPLHLAVEYQHYAIMSALLEAGSSIDLMNARGHTPLNLAIEQDKFEAIILCSPHVKNIYESHHGKQSLASYAFFFNPDLLRHLCKTRQFDLNQKSDTGASFNDHLNGLEVELSRQSAGQITKQVFSPRAVKKIIQSNFTPQQSDNLPKDSALNTAVKSTISSTIETIQQTDAACMPVSEAKQSTITIVHPDLALAQKQEKEEQEKKLQQTIQDKNKQLSQTRKLERENLTGRSSASAAKTKSKHKTTKIKTDRANLLPENTSNHFPSRAMELDSVPENFTWINQDSDFADSMAIALYPLSKKDGETPEQEKIAMESIIAKRQAPPTLATRQHLSKFMVKLPEKISSLKMLLTENHPNFLLTFNHLKKIATKKISHNRLVSLVILRNWLACSNYYYCNVSLTGRKPFAAYSDSENSALRNLITQSYYLPSEDSIKDGFCNFSTEIAKADANEVLENIHECYILLNRTLCIPLLASYPKKSDSENEQDLLTQRNTLCQEIITLKTTQHLDPSEFFGPAADILLLVSYALIQAINSKFAVQDKTSHTLKMWRNSIAHTECTGSETQIYTEATHLDALLRTLYQADISKRLCSPGDESILSTPRSVSDQGNDSLQEHSNHNVADHVQSLTLSAHSSSLFKPVHQKEDTTSETAKSLQASL